MALPFSPVSVQTTTLTWPAPGLSAVSTTAILAPYRPLQLHAEFPCPVLRAAAARSDGPKILATGAGAEGLVVTARGAEAVMSFDGQTVRMPIVAGVSACRVIFDADSNGVRLRDNNSDTSIEVSDQPVPRVFGFRTELPASETAGLTVRAVVGEPFTSTPSALKVGLIVAQGVAAAISLWLLAGRRPRWSHPRLHWRPVWWIDGVLLAVLVSWAVIGPLAVDDGWATTIARNVVSTGNAGNYFRWWNAAEVPFSLDQRLLAPLTAVSIAPVWLRVPSTVLAALTWLVLSRGVLGAALPKIADAVRVRALAAVCFLAAWLPFNLGVRPEALVALGVTVVLALAMRARSAVWVGWLVLAAVLTVPVSPNGVLVVAPVLVYAPRLWRALRRGATDRRRLVGRVASLVCIAAVGLTVVFADDSWDALVVATDWHTFFGPSLPWYEESVRYHYLLRQDQQGSFAKRLPVLLTLAMLPLVAALWRRRDGVDRASARLGIVTALTVALLALSPSKWSYHFGAAAGLFAGLLTVAVVQLTRRVPPPSRRAVLVGVVGSALLAASAAVAFHGPNAWWLPVVYDVPWADTPPRPLGIPLDSPWPWLAVVAVAVVVTVLRRHPSPAWMVAAGPAAIAVAAMGVALTLLVGSFAAAPVRRAPGSLALANTHRITAGRVCGLADDVEVMPDGPVLASTTEPVARLDGFVPGGGFLATAPPPDRPGTATAAFVWGSRDPDVASTGTMTSAWFRLPALASDGGIALSVAGRTDGGNALALQFGRADGADVEPLGDRAPDDYPQTGEDSRYPLWRTIGVDSKDVPAEADRVRVQATDARADPFGWLAFTGPRLRTVIPLNRFLANRGPVLVSWPQSFLFPCVRNIPMVVGGVAQTPDTVIESPQPRETQDRSTDIGGTFAELAVFGELGEVPSRLVGHPEVDWGSVLISYDTAARDDYQRTATSSTVSGIDGVTHQRAER